MEEKLEEVVEETTQDQVEQKPEIDESKFESAGDDSVIKVDLSKPPIPKEEKNETKEDNADDSGVVAESKDAEPAEKQEEVQPEAKAQEAPVLEEITEDSTEEEVAEVEEQIEEAVAEAEATGKPLPENIQKLMDFMEETGGTVEDYVRLNADYSNVDETTLLKEYYKKHKPHLDLEDINLILEDYQWDEDIHEEKEIRKKKLAFKEEVAKAKNYLEEVKAEYYDEIKLRPGVTQEQQKAMDFFNRYNKQQEQAEQLHETFKQRTQQLFNEDFKGFDFEVAGKRYKYNIQNREKVAENQSNITNLVGKFLDPDGNVVDPNGYHKAMYAAENVDKIATHFYEQGKADAVKEVVNKSKNLSDVKAREGNKDIFVGGFKVKAISGADSTKLKIQKRKFN